MEAAIAKSLQQNHAVTQSDDEFGDGSSGSDVEQEEYGQQQSGESGEEEAGSELEGASDGEGGEGLGEDGEELDNEGTGGSDDADAAADTEGDDDSSSDEEEGGEAGGSKKARGQGFLEGGKADAFAKAFSKILERAEDKADKGDKDAPILAGSKSLAKRKAEVAEGAQHDKEAKRLRLEMKQRGHVVPTKRGQDPAADAREKALQRLATRGVVRLFNAIAKAQKQLREAAEATGSKAKAAKLGRASFLAELKGAGASAAPGPGASGDRVLVPSVPGQAAAAEGAAAAGNAQQRQRQQQRGRQPAGGGESSSEEEGAAGWEVLQKGFAGLQGGNKMKDWDKAVSDGEESPGEEMDDDDEDDSGGEGW